jgi:hypothetical protein
MIHTTVSSILTTSSIYMHNSSNMTSASGVPEQRGRDKVCCFRAVTSSMMSRGTAGASLTLRRGTAGASSMRRRGAAGALATGAWLGIRPPRQMGAWQKDGSGIANQGQGPSFDNRWGTPPRGPCTACGWNSIQYRFGSTVEGVQVKTYKDVRAFFYKRFAVAVGSGSKGCELKFAELRGEGGLHRIRCRFK